MNRHWKEHVSVNTRTMHTNYNNRFSKSYPNINFHENNLPSPEDTMVNYKQLNQLIEIDVIKCNLSLINQLFFGQLKK